MRLALAPRTLLLAAALVLLLAAAPSLGKAAAPAPLTAGSRYLALGDSVTFGFRESTVVPKPDYKRQASFLGYPEHIARELHVRVTNPSCPGETSASLINASAQSNGCENSLGSKVGYRTSFPLHVRYKGSQLAFAVSFLRAHRDVRLVSLMIGANDLFLCQKLTSDGCLSASEQRSTLAKISRNVKHILTSIRKLAGYTGQIVILNYYSLNYALSLESGISQALNRAQDNAARPFHVSIADGYGVFGAAVRDFGGSTCVAGLLTEWGTPATCGVHPSFAGQALLAEAVLRATRN